MRNKKLFLLSVIPWLGSVLIYAAVSQSEPAAPFVGVVNSAVGGHSWVMPESMEYSSTVDPVGAPNGKILDLGSQKACISLARYKLLDTVLYNGKPHSAGDITISLATQSVTVTQMSPEIRQYDNKAVPFTVLQNLHFSDKTPATSRRINVTGILTAKVKQEETLSSTVYDFSLQFSLPPFASRPAVKYDVNLGGSVKPVPLPSPLPASNFCN